MSSRAYIINNSRSPKAVLKSVPLNSVRWTAGFWAERFRQTYEVTVRQLWELLADPQVGHVLDNMRIAAGLQHGEFAGVDWQDEWLYKWIEAAACLFKATSDPWLDARMDEAVALIGQAQEPDGYISTQITARKKKRFQNPHEHELYNMGHLLTAGVIHYRMTHKDSLLKIAVRTGDFLCQTIGVSVEPYFAHNPSAVMGLVELYRQTGQRKYLDCAKLIVDKRGSKPRPSALFHQRHGIDGTDLIQDRVPLRQAHEVVGHNVFFTYLFAGATDVYLETGDESLFAALKRLWHDLVHRKMCINTGVSPMGQGLSHGHPVIEAVGPAYFLPNSTAYNETCGQIGNLMWNFRMLCAEEDARYADLIEQSLYNGILPGIGLDGKSWFYQNPLRRHKDYVPKGGTDMALRSQPGRYHICCPSNLLRTLAQLQGYFYSVCEHGVWIHHYGSNEFSYGDDLALEQKTDYPWDGRITITVHQAPNRTFFIKLRIPAWAKSASVKVNGVSLPAPSNVYVKAERKWSAGDVVEIDLPMHVRLMEAHPKAEHLRNQVAIMRGPILYCLESVDLPNEIDLNNVYIPTDIALRPVPAAGMPFGIQALEGTALYRRDDPWDENLYRPLAPFQMESIPIRLIPYFAWANRGPSAMSVWLPVCVK